MAEVRLDARGITVPAGTLLATMEFDGELDESSRFMKRYDEIKFDMSTRTFSGDPAPTIFNMVLLSVEILPPPPPPLSFDELRAVCIEIDGKGEIRFYNTYPVTDREQGFPFEFNISGPGITFFRPEGNSSLPGQSQFGVAHSELAEIRAAAIVDARGTTVPAGTLLMSMKFEGESDEDGLVKGFHDIGIRLVDESEMLLNGINYIPPLIDYSPHDDSPQSDPPTDEVIFPYDEGSDNEPNPPSGAVISIVPTLFAAGIILISKKYQKQGKN
jgi:hypothetical protein